MPASPVSTVLHLHHQEVLLEGRGKVSLTPSTYVTSGGEASIYRLKDTVVKIYTDPDKMQRNRMEDKIIFLAKLAHPFIVAPRGIVKAGSRGSPVGYYMSYSQGEPLSRVFTNAFRQRESFSDTDALKVAEGMREVYQFVHNEGALLVDANELNWLMSRNQTGRSPEPRVLDVDSWAIGSRWPATVIMPSIRDYHTAGFDELSDWFSWGIVTFQLFVGIHPYKGRLQNYLPNELERRMKDNASVFSGGIHLNHNVRPFTSIPPLLLDWYRFTFQDGARSPPPSLFASPIRQQPVNLTTRITIRSGSGDRVSLEKVFVGGDDPLTRIWPCGVGLTRSSALIDLSTRKLLGHGTPDSEIIRIGDEGFLRAWHHPTTGTLLFSIIDKGQGKDWPLLTESKTVVRANNRLLVVTDSGLRELKVTYLSRPLLSWGKKWSIMPNATKWFDGVGVEDCLGAKFLIIPYGPDSCASIRTPELDKVEVLDAVGGHRQVVVSVLDPLGSYKQLQFSFGDDDYGSYLLTTSPSDTADLNVAILPNGVSATIPEDGTLIVLVPQTGHQETTKSSRILSTMQLQTWKNKVVFLQDGDLWQIRTS